MPLMQGKSKKAFSKNVATEMDAGKPQKQSLAIAYNIKRKNSKKFAKGGLVSAKDEKRPMPDDLHNDSLMAGQNRGNKAPGQDAWTDNPTIKQAQRPSPTRLSQPKGVGSDALSMRQRAMHDDEEDLGDSIYPETDRAQPIERDNEIGPDRQGPRVSDMEAQHNNKRAPYQMAKEDQYSEDESEDDMNKIQSPPGRYAKGGPVMEPKDSGLQLMERDDEAHLMDSEYPSGPHDKQPDSELDESHDYGMSSGDPEEVSPHTGESESDMLRRHAMERASFAHGGDVMNPKLQQSHLEPDEESSMAREIMHKRKMAAGGAVREDLDYPANGDGTVDLEANSEEDLNNEDQMSFNAGMKEQYDDRQISRQPRNSNLKGDQREEDSENEHDSSIVSEIRKKSKSKKM